MSKELTEEAIENLSILCKGGRKAAAERIESYGDIIKKEIDTYGNIKYYFSEHAYLYYDRFYAEMALEAD
ncbi:MAG: hypothetical protein LBU25_08620 [Treponema sp.]|jgi:hypothetical protein|nr:hypothetical protein [Treponema sp.]